MNKPQKSVEGAQSVFRALDLLGLIARQHDEGAALADLVEATGLDRTTVYRLVGTLEYEHLVERDAVTRRYRLGMEAMQIGLTTMGRAPILDECTPAMQEVARASEDTVFLIVRNGDFAHCLHLEQGTFPIRTVTQHVGGMRLLGLGTAGLAVLATLPDAEIDAIYRRHRDEYERHGLTNARLSKRVRQIRADGHAVTVDVLTPGVCGVGLAFEIGHGGHAALSVATIIDRMPPPRRLWLAELMREQLRARGFTPVAGTA